MGMRFGFIHDAQSIIRVAELGVVLFQFVIGLEMQASRLWAMRGEIFGLGARFLGDRRAGLGRRCTRLSDRSEVYRRHSGAAVLMDAGGLSMAMGAFLAGVLFSESRFRHQLQADIEPFRGLLLGLFFLGHR